MYSSWVLIRKVPSVINQIEYSEYIITLHPVKIEISLNKISVFSIIYVFIELYF